MRVFCRDLGPGNEGHFLVGKIFEPHYSSITALEAGVFLSGKNHQTIAAISSDGHRLDKRLVGDGLTIADGLSR